MYYCFHVYIDKVNHLELANILLLNNKLEILAHLFLPVSFTNKVFVILSDLDLHSTKHSLIIKWKQHRQIK